MPESGPGSPSARDAGWRIVVLLGGLFLVSGFSGLIYESVWSHYLKLFLGHAAYAQALVLAIFMGGMAAGAWLAARHGRGWPNLLLAYAVAEGLVGLAGLVFHHLFDASLALAYGRVIPWLGDGPAVEVFKWGLAALLILPQSVLLGATFPLMAGALVRRFPEASGRTLAMLYFVNSAGAAVGVLASGFVLIPRVGLPGTILTAALINVLLALVVWLVSRDPIWRGVPHRPRSAPARVAASGAMAAAGSWPAVLLGAALLTGFGSFLYEIAWIRMLNLVLGTTTHAFELMLSAFILGLALGSLWIRRRLDHLADPVGFLGRVQVLMGLAALATVPLYDWTFEAMAFALGALARTDGGYLAFNLASHGIAMAVMLPSTFLAGMTLPLITHRLLVLGHGERAIGQAYALNTLGAILGVFVAIHLLIPLLGLKAVIVAGAAIDIGLGVFLLARTTAGATHRAAWGRFVPAAALGGAGLLAVGLLAELDPRRMASGVYRYGTTDVRGDTEVSYHRDGKTATVHLVSHPLGHLTLTTNGKPDATIFMGEGYGPTGDEHTMVLLGALPLAARPEASRVAVVGFGSGLTTHVLLASARVKQVVTVEIEPAMVEASEAFRPRVERAYADPRSRIHLGDARTFLAGHGEAYDIIVSEPSNPWVSGIASLFTEEFYRHLHGRLAADGVLAQWLHLYELDEGLLASVMLAIGRVFEDYTVYTANDRDLVILAGAPEAVRAEPKALFAEPELASETARIGLHRDQDLEILYLGDRWLLEGLFTRRQVPVNSDYFPFLDQGAARARFLDAQADGILEVGRSPAPILDLLAPRPTPWSRTDLSPNPGVRRALSGRVAAQVHDFLLGDGSWRAGVRVDPDLRARATLLRAHWESCGVPLDEDTWIDLHVQTARDLVSYLRPQELEDLWARSRRGACAEDLGPVQASWLDLLEAASARDPSGMARHGRALLAREEETRGRVLYPVYALAMAMLGELALGRSEAAWALWVAHGGRLLGLSPPTPDLAVLIERSRPR
jgi:spermidine synthase